MGGEVVGDSGSKTGSCIADDIGDVPPVLARGTRRVLVLNNSEILATEA